MRPNLMRPNLHSLALACATLALAAPAAAADPGTDLPHAATFPLTCPDRTVTVTAEIAGSALVFHDVASTANFRVAKRLTLPRQWAYDALSPDGRILYATQYLGTGANPRYQVRSVNSSSRSLASSVIGWP